MISCLTLQLSRGRCASASRGGDKPLQELKFGLQIPRHSCIVVDGETGKPHKGRVLGPADFIATEASVAVEAGEALPAIGSNGRDLHPLAPKHVFDRVHMICAGLLQRHFYQRHFYVLCALIAVTVTCHGGIFQTAASTRPLLTLPAPAVPIQNGRTALLVQRVTSFSLFCVHCSNWLDYTAFRASESRSQICWMLLLLF